MEEENNQVTEETNELTPLQELSEKLTQSEDKYVRLYAEFDNYKRRTMKDKDLDYFKQNAEEDYIKTPISVLRYITELEQRLEELTKQQEQ